MASYTTIKLWDHPYSADQLGLGMDLSGGMRQRQHPTPERWRFYEK